MKTTQEWVAEDLAHIWHPCSQMKDYESLPPIVIDHGKGSYLYDIDGKEYIDIVSSWWANLLGHCNPVISKAIEKQLEVLEHVIFANLSHKPAIRLCDELIKILPKGLTKFHFNDNGSGAVEAGLKMAFQYQHQIGQAQRTKFMCLTGSYHGETIGALSVGSLDLFAEMYQPMLMKSTIHIEAPNCYRCPYGLTRESCQCQCFEQAEKAFERDGHDTVAIIVEPLLQGSAGMRIYPALYLEKLRHLCDAYGVLLIADEIATGFGRTGKMFAFNHTQVSPDIMTVSKGLTGGYLPMSITITTQQIYDAFYADYLEHKAFVHSHTYAGNPLGCVAALAVQKIMREDKILEKANKRALWLHETLEEAVGGHKHVGEIRHIGLINAIELVANRETKQPFDPSKRTGYAIYKRALDYGLLLRPLGDVLYFNAPLTTTKDTYRQAIERMQKAMKDVLG